MHLLDVNALIALVWAPHEHHDAMHAWFSRHARHGWATCTVTQAAFVRIACQPAFAGRYVAPREAAELLQRNLEHPAHQRLAVDLGLDDVLGACSGGVVGHRQVGDAMLLALAIRSRIKLLTFDAGLRHLLASDVERSQHLTVLV